MTNQHNFNILNGDTDSISVYKEGFQAFERTERKLLLNELNSQCPEGLTWEDDGYYKTMVIVKAKNYILLGENGDLTIKGSALMASTKSPKLKQLIKDVINSILNDNLDILPLYNQYVKEVNVITDILPWSVRKTITTNVLNGTRKNETNVNDAILGTEIREGDRVYMFYREDGTLCLAEKFNGDYSKDKLFQQIFDTVKVFSTVLDLKEIANYKLKRNKKDLDLL